MINQTISHYRITAKLGQGGMGEVYRATDTKLDRDVAIKVLPDEFADDPKRLARFEREAKALAALHHPNIASIFGFEEHQGKHYLVLELVEGQTLAERLEQGPLEVTEALETCRQIAEAFEAAHDKSIIHRDLKPANVKLSAEGQVKVLDFGLAKTLPPTGSGAGVSANLADSPTITDNTTMPGTILGTAAYMSPEQARGRPVDQRCDIWSLGCVLFECLTGKRACPGEDVTETLAAVLRGEPQWSALPQDTPPTIQLLLRKCLAKDRKRRLHAIADARIDLEQALDDPSASVLRLSDAALQETSAGGGQRHLATGGLVLIVALVTAVLVWILKPTPPAPTPQPPPIRRLSVDLGAEGSLFVRHGTAIRLSPDGSTLAYIARSQDGTGPPQLYLRRLDQLEATPLSAAAGAEQFCFSPDGQWIAFRVVNSDTLQKVSVTGGSAMTLCDSGPTRGIDWSTDGWIVFASPEHRGLSRVSAAGGTPEPLTSLAEEENTQRWPQILPGGGAVLYSAVTRGPEADGSSIMVQKLPTGKPERLRQGGFHARYLASGHLVYLQGGTLFAAAFDLDTLTLQGQPAPVLEEVAANNIGAALFDVSSEGTLVYVQGSISERLYEFEWVDREGIRQSLPLPKGNYEGFALSPRGERLAYVLDDGPQTDIWIYDIARGVRTRLTIDPADDYRPVWSPSGETIVFASNRGGVMNLFCKRADGSDAARRLTDTPNVQLPWSWHPAGRHLAILNSTHEGGWDLSILTLEGNDRSGWTAGETKDFLATRFLEATGRFSPDGRWLAYASNEGGEFQVFVQRFPGGGGKQQISIEGIASGWPAWSGTGLELIFSTQVMSDSRELQIFVADYRVDGTSFIPDRPVPWQGGTFYARGPDTPSYDLHPDGQRLVVRKLVDDKSEQNFDHVVLFENFFDYLREHVPTGIRQ